MLRLGIWSVFMTLLARVTWHTQAAWIRRAHAFHIHKLFRECSLYLFPDVFCFNYLTVTVIKHVSLFLRWNHCSYSIDFQYFIRWPWNCAQAGLCPAGFYQLPHTIPYVVQLFMGTIPWPQFRLGTIPMEPFLYPTILIYKC